MRIPLAALLERFCPAPGLDRANAGFSPERAKKHPRACDVMKIEPFRKPAVWMYQFWQ